MGCLVLGHTNKQTWSENLDPRRPHPRGDARDGWVEVDGISWESPFIPAVVVNARTHIVLVVHACPCGKPAWWVGLSGRWA